VSPKPRLVGTEGFSLNLARLVALGIEARSHELSRKLFVRRKWIIGVPALAAVHNSLVHTLGFKPSPIKTLSAHVKGFTRGDLIAYLTAVLPVATDLSIFMVRISIRSSLFLRGHSPHLLLPSLAWRIFFLLEKVRAYASELLDCPQQNAMETVFYTDPE
jgi:hypothetical protein